MIKWSRAISGCLISNLIFLQYHRAYIADPNEFHLIIINYISQLKQENLQGVKAINKVVLTSAR
jgi:hypothetical protein